MNRPQDRADTGHEPQKDLSVAELSYTDEESDIENRSNQSFKAFDTGATASELTLTQPIFDEFKKTVFTARPNIANLYSTVGEVSFYAYAKSHVRENRNKITKQRKSEFTSTVTEHVRKILGSGIAESVAKQLKTNDSISTVQHFSPISHPDSLNSILENALPYFDTNNPGLQNVLVFACAGVSFNNTKFPRGHLFHTMEGDTLHTNQIGFFGHTVDARPVIHHPAYTADAITECRNSLLQLQRENKVTKEVFRQIMDILQEIYNQPHPLAADNFTDQLTITNYHFFNKLFKNYSKFVPSLVYLSQESVVLDLLLTHHMQQDTTIHRMLFDPKVQELVAKHFEGVTGAFVKEKELGTYLFWGLPKYGKYRVQLWKEGNMLVAKDKSYSVELTPEAIAQAIQRQELIPSVMLTFCVLALYYGMFLGGGYEQTYYLTQTLKRYKDVLTEIGDTESIQATENLITTNLVIPRPLLVYLDGGNERRIPATGLDMLLYGQSGRKWDEILTAAKNITLGKIIERTLPSIYREYCRDSTNAEQLAQVFERNIEKFTGLDKNIPEYGSLIKEEPTL